MRKLDIFWGIALTASATTCFFLWRQLQEERAFTARLRAHQAAIAPTPATAPAASAAHASAASSKRSTPTPEGVETPKPADRRREDWRAYQQRLLEDPRYREVLREQRRLTYRLRRDNAIRLLGFSPATADAIIELDIDREFQMQKLNPEPATDEERQQQKAQYEADDREHDAKLLALLGQERFDRWQNYMETRGTRMQVDRFRSQLNGPDLLRDDQVEPLISALAVEQQQLQSELQDFRESFDWNGERTELTKKFLDRQSQITKAGHRRMLEGAGSVLSASQLQRLADMLNNDQAQRANQLRLDALREKLGPMPGADAAGSN